MWNLCLDWLKEHLLPGNLLATIIELAILVKSVGHDNQEVFVLCRDFIAENIKDDFLKLSRSWSFVNDNIFIEFMLQQEILYFTLPVLVNSVIKNDTDVRFVLTQLESKGLVHALSKQRETARANELIEKMSEKMESLETSRKVIRLQCAIIEEREANRHIKKLFVPQPSLNTLLQDDYCSFPVERVLGLEKEYGLQHFEYIEVILAWIKNKTPSQESVSKLSGTIRQHDLAFRFFETAKQMLMYCHKEKYKEPYMLSHIQTVYGQYRYYDYALSDSIFNSDHLTFKTVIYCLMSLKDQELFLKHQEISFRNVPCKKCKLQTDIKLRLVPDQVPCLDVESDHFTIKLVYAWRGKHKNREFLSFLTNSSDIVIKTLKDWFSDYTCDSILHFVYECKPGTGTSMQSVNSRKRMLDDAFDSRNFVPGDFPGLSF